MERMRDRIVREVEKDIDLKTEIIHKNVDEICRIVSICTEMLRDNGKIVTFGNGGSAADAQHLTAEFIGRFRLSRAALPAIALSADTAVLTCIANDYGYENIFARQIEGLVDLKDVCIGITTSGKSENVRKGLERARDKGASTIALTGMEGESLLEVAETVLVIPSRETYLIQQGIMTVGHVICNLIEEELFGG